MNRIAITTIVAFIMNLAVLGYAQQPAQDAGPPTQEQNKPREVSPPPRQPEVNPPRGQEESKPPKHEQEAKPPKAERQEVPRPTGEQKKPANEQHGSVQQGNTRPAGKSAHIPDPQFKANFGKQHAFNIKQVVTTTTIVPNQTQFVFAGYTFIFLDPWPADWLFTDECYIDFVEDEYFLFDVFHPGVRVALFVVG